jgi:RimJ/RimL family protein N-acetyltransferase
LAVRNEGNGLTRLVETQDGHFAWMLGEQPRLDDLNLPWDGLDAPHVIRFLRGAAARLRAADCAGSWMIVDGTEAVGLCSYKAPPGPGRTVELGYGVVSARRGRGYATRAVALVLDRARADPTIETLTAETATDNLASQQVLARNGFRQVGWRSDDEDGDLILWRIDVAG